LAVEVGVLPSIFSQVRFAYCRGIDDYLPRVRIEVDVAQVSRSGLQSVENQSSGFVFDLPAEQQVQHLHDGALNGVGIFEDGHVDGWPDLHAGGVKLDVLLAPSSMKVAKTIFAEGWRSALSAVDLDVFAAMDVGVVGHRAIIPLGSIYWNPRFRGC